MSKDADKPITRAELEGMGHKELSKVATKKRILAALPPEPDEDGGDADADDEGDDVQSTSERLRRAIVKEEARKDGD